jgi:dGTPase
LEQIEQQEDEFLAPYASRSSRSRGRLHSELPHRYRTDFQRDRDRVLHSRAFRRLQYKTQVFPFPVGDHFRNRLTHTLEVAQIARTVARSLGANEDLTEAIVLAHDLGHPPFGHAGEKVLNELSSSVGGFEHNRQSLRIVDFIEPRTEHTLGLNLVYETRAGLLKHGADYPRYDHPLPLPELGSQPGLEAQIANLADEIAYHSHDLDDGLRSGLLDWDGLCGLSLWQRVLEEGGAEGPEGQPFLRSRMIIRVIDLLASDLIETSAHLLAASGVRSTQDVMRAEAPVVSFSDGVRQMTREVARYLFENFYRHREVIRMVGEAERILRDLWTAYREDPSRLPAHVRDPEGDTMERAMADYMAGMTDRFAMDEHRKLLTPRALV